MSKFLIIKVVLDGYHRYFFGVKVKTVKHIGGRRLRMLYMPGQIILIILAITQIMAIWTPGINLQDHLNLACVMMEKLGFKNDPHINCVYMPVEFIL